MNLGDLNKVWDIKALKKAGADEARKILEKIAKQVQPIMRKHKWRVKVLSEFCPKNPALLGLNVGGGVHVKLRLRRPNRDWDFFPFDQILDTMLHELCHNAHGPHNASFYKLWDEIRKECDGLMAMGVTGTGEGFDLPGRRLGGFSHQPPLTFLRQTALAAAEKRSRLGYLLPSGPNRLGGDNSIMVALSPVQAAGMAAERRLQDDVWCGLEEVAEEEGGSNDFTHNHAETSGKSRYESFADVDADADANACKRRRESTFKNELSTTKRCKGIGISSGGQSKSVLIDASSSGLVLDSNRTFDAKDSLKWECALCTLMNPPLAPICELCGNQKTKDVEDKYKVWACEFCTLENSVKLDNCAACGQWRYSHGPPVVTPAPNLGT